MRSWLFVPGDSERKLEKSLQSGADALIVDLEDSVAAGSKSDARRLSTEFVSANRESAPSALYVRVNAFDTGLTTADLEAVMPSGPAGIVLPKACGRADGEKISRLLDELEAGCGLQPGSTKVLPIITETAAGVLSAPSWNRPIDRLCGLTWGAEDLSADMGIAKPRTSDGLYSDVFRHARTMTILASSASQTDAIDTVFIDFRDEQGLREECRASAHDGFTGKLAIHPAQVPIINDVFAVSEADLAEAKQVVEAFAGAGDVGVIGIGGRMVDRPHLLRAERILARAERQRD